KGRFIFDVYNRDALQRFPEERVIERSGAAVRCTHHWSGDRLAVRLEYESGQAADVFEWRLYTPAEVVDLASAIGFRCLVSCPWFNEELPPSPEHARMQFVLEREG